MIREISKESVEELSKEKEEDEWMLKLRLKALENFKKSKNPKWLIAQPRLKDIVIFSKRLETKASWEEIPKDIKKTYEALNLPEIEKKYLLGLGVQEDSWVIYKKTKEELQKRGVIHLSSEEAYKKHRELFKKYFANLVGINDNKYASLHYAFWSGGSFIFVPRNVKVPFPISTYFRLMLEGIAQFEHTIIVLQPGAELTYIEGCSAPIFSKSSLHSGVVELFLEENSKLRFITIQNWSRNVYNLPTKRAILKKNAKIEWITADIGSKVNVVYPMSILSGENSSSSNYFLTFSPKNTKKEGGAKIIHASKNTSSLIISKSISFGYTSFRSMVKVNEGAKNSRVRSVCDTFLLDKNSIGKTFPHFEIFEKDSYVSHEASMSSLDEEKFNYLRAKGFEEEEILELLVNGFTSRILEKIPLEYALEIKRLFSIELKRKVG
ncbi:MAG: Fe-S cluster assembly protein SufB [Candidatus Micrarchaeales archaeon]